MDHDELASWLRLTLTPGVGNATARRLLAAFGLPQAIFRQGLAALGEVVGPAMARTLLQEPPSWRAQLDLTWAWLRSTDDPHLTRRIVALGDAAYPQALLTMEDPPLMLYWLGAAGLQPNMALAPDTSGPLAPEFIAYSLARSIAVVGSRGPTAQGAIHAREFSRSLSAAGLTVVSGLALGVDGAAHEGALEGLGSATDRLATVAVIGTGLDRVYPRAHKALARRIAKQGLIISEYPLGTPPLAANFPRRNRLIAGLTRGTLVIEAALQSGSLITARLASEMGREVFALPGSILSPQSRGCHALIKQGAKLVESVQDVLDEIQPDVASFFIADSPQSKRASGLIDQDLEHNPALLEALGHDPVGLDALQARTGLDTASLQVQLLTLELEGQVARLPGGLFQRVASA